MQNKKEIYIVGGPNGAGKTTFVENFLPNYVNIRNFVNADAIASGLSPLDSKSMDFKAGRLMLDLIKNYIKKGESFGFETTLAGRKWISLLKELKSNDYTIHIFFLDLSSLDLSLSRVKYRVEAGGHEIPEETVRRRYTRCRSNFISIYKKLVDYWYLFNNSGDKPEMVVRSENKKLIISNQKYYGFFMNSIKGV